MMSGQITILGLLGACMLSTAAAAQTAPIDLTQDGPWIDLPPGVVIDTGPPSLDQIVAMADLDGDPSVQTPEEAAMILLLMQVLGTQPVTD